MFRQFVRRRLRRTFGENRSDHLRNDLARAMHKHRVADAYVLTPDVVLVVQGGLRDGHAADLDRLEHGEWIEAASTSNVDFDGPEDGGGLHRRKFEGDGPAWLAADCSQLALHVEAVDFDYYAVDLVGERLAAVLPFRARAYNLVDDRRVTQAQYLNTIADCLQVPHVSRRVPYAALYAAARTAERAWQAIGRRNAAPPPVTTYGVNLLGTDQMFSIGKAHYELGYVPQYDISRGGAEGVKWYLAARKGNPETQEEREAVQART